MILALFFYSNKSALAQITFNDTSKPVFVYEPVPPVRFSLRAGLNIAQIFGAGSQAFNHFGFAGGVRLDWRFHKRWSFAPEVLYDMKGAAKWADPDNGDYYSFSIDLDYVEIPLMFNFYFGRKLNLSLEFGPSVGFLVRAKAYENNLAINSTNPSGFHVYDISLNAGISYHLPKGFTLNFRYSNSIVPIAPTLGTPVWGTYFFTIGQLNSVLNFSLMYTFDFRKKDKTDKESRPKKKKKKKKRGDVYDEDDWEE